MLGDSTTLEQKGARNGLSLRAEKVSEAIVAAATKLAGFHTDSSVVFGVAERIVTKLLEYDYADGQWPEQEEPVASAPSFSDPLGIFDRPEGEAE